MNPILEAALSYASMGWHVFPVAGWRKELADERDNGKRPATANGFKDSSSDPEQIRRWFPDGHRYNLGLDCGSSGIAVVDIDVKNGKDGVGNWEKFCQEKNCPSNGTSRQFTPSGGYHLFYRGACKSVNDKLAVGVDTKSTGGYVLLAPSTIDGKPYYWDKDSNENQAELPQQVIDAVERSKSAPSASAPVRQSPVQHTATGQSLMEMAASDVAGLKMRSGQLEGPCPFCGQGKDCFFVTSRSGSPGRDGTTEYFHCRKCLVQGDSVEWDIKVRKTGVTQAKMSRGIKVDSQYIPITAKLGGDQRPIIGQDAPPAEKPDHLTEEQTSCEWLADYRRVEFPMILDNLLPAGIVGGINAEGGTGKTYLTIAMFAAVACGVTWGPFKPTRPHKVLLLLAEDPQDIVRNRVFDIASEIIPPAFRSLLLINFKVASVRGICGPIMGMVNGAPGPTAWMDWLDETIKAHPGVELLGLDPLRKFYGMDENKNELAHAFIGELERISLKHALAILYNHHIAKMMRDQAVGQITGRGAGGLSDNCRWMAAMRTVDEKTAEYMELEGAASEYVEFAVTKSNYAPRLPRPAYFKRAQHGVLVPAAVDNDRLHAQAEYLCDLVDGLRLSVRDIAKEAKASDIRAAMKERFSGFKKDDVHRIVKHGVSMGIMVEIPMPFGRGGRMTEVIARGPGND